MKKLLINENIIRFVKEFISFYEFKIVTINDINNNDDIYIISFMFENADKIINKCNKIYIINLEQLSVKLNEKK